MALLEPTIRIDRIDAGVGHCDQCGDWTPWGYNLMILGRGGGCLGFVCRSCEDCIPTEVHIKIVLPEKGKGE